MFTLIYVYFASVTFLCCPLRRQSIVWPILYFFVCIFVLFYFTLNLLLGENDHSLVIIFFIQLERKRKKITICICYKHWEINYTKRWNCIWCYLFFGCNWLGFLSWSMIYVMDGQLWLTWVYHVRVCCGNCQG
jgi:hypothetical protein